MYTHNIFEDIKHCRYKWYLPILLITFDNGYITNNECISIQCSMHYIYIMTWYFQIKLSVIKKFIASGGWGIFGLLMASVCLFAVIQILINLWLSSWSNDVVNYSFQEARNMTSMRLGVYGGLSAMVCQYQIYDNLFKYKTMIEVVTNLLFYFKYLMI